MISAHKTGIHKAAETLFDRFESLAINQALKAAHNRAATEDGMLI